MSATVISKLVYRVITNDREKEADPEIWEKGFVFFMKYYREHLSDFTRPPEPSRSRPAQVLGYSIGCHYQQK